MENRLTLYIRNVFKMTIITIVSVSKYGLKSRNNVKYFIVAALEGL